MKNTKSTPKTYTLNVLKFEVDRVANKTRAEIETKEFIQWFEVSGRLNQGEFVRVIRPTIERMIGEVAA